MQIPPLSDDVPIYERIYALVRQVPPGRVITYGQVANVVGGCSARLVGYAMAALRYNDHPDVPWQRVVNRKGKISLMDIPGQIEQRRLLEDEGVRFDAKDEIDFREFGWLGPP